MKPKLSARVIRAASDEDIEEAFASGAHKRIAALSITADPFFDTRRVKLVELAARHTLPTMYPVREYVEAGGLVSYGVDVAQVYRQVGVYTARVLNGTEPADLPVMQASKFDFV